MAETPWLFGKIAQTETYSIVVKQLIETKMSRLLTEESCILQRKLNELQQHNPAFNNKSKHMLSQQTCHHVLALSCTNIVLLFVLCHHDYSVMNDDGI